jgi:TP901 family phage tail tape measure protein
VNEIATAMKYSSNSAQQAGIDFEHLAAYITIISSTTRQSSETIGQSLKTLSARFTDIKQGFDIGEGLDVNINNVEKSLRDVNIPLRDSANNFRDIQDVISDLGKVWSGLTEVQQNNIAKQVAGVRQKEQFLVP